MAFYYFCKLVPKYQQHNFLEEFQNSRGRAWHPNFIIDENGNIQNNKYNRFRYYKRGKDNQSYKGPYIFNSSDLKVELRHKVTGHKKDNFNPVYEVETYTCRKWSGGMMTSTRNGKLLYYEYGNDRFKPKPLFQRYRAQNSDFEAVIIQGWQKVFDSKQDPEFKRLMAEKHKKSFVNKKKDDIIKAQNYYDLILKTEKKKREEKEFNDLKILQHGFDLKTSFRK